MWTITFRNNGNVITWVCQNSEVYNQELTKLQSMGLVIIHHGASMYIRQDDGQPVWNELASRKTTDQIKARAEGKLPKQSVVLAAGGKLDDSITMLRMLPK